ncbi:MAG: PH domain-containing protein, partial [Burkholderiaceae bacterium]|nr:PH domain-containing protein [Burkholderiaceae bacterium]
MPCPVCAETVKKAALKCRYCGADLREFAANRSTAGESPLFKGHPVPVYSAWQWLLVIATIGIAWLVFWLKSLATTYEITSQRIRIERGLLSTTKDSVELFTIEHFDIKKPLGMRMAGHCILQMRSSDSSFSSFSLYGIPKLESIADAMRECSLRERKRRQVVSVIRP